LDSSGIFYLTGYLVPGLDHSVREKVSPDFKPCLAVVVFSIGLFVMLFLN
jgi:hypothetical protein